MNRMPILMFYFWPWIKWFVASMFFTFFLLFPIASVFSIQCTFMTTYCRADEPVRPADTINLFIDKRFRIGLHFFFARHLHQWQSLLFSSSPFFSLSSNASCVIYSVVFRIIKSRLSLIKTFVLEERKSKRIAICESLFWPERRFFSPYSRCP